MAYIAHLYRPCRTCACRAVMEVFNRYRVSHGLYCREHGLAELARLKKLEKGR